MSKAALSEFVTGTCGYCGNTGVAIFRDNRLCEECDSAVIHCNICKADQHENDHCRHVFWARNFEWRGAGVGVDDDVKPALLRLLDLMPKGFAADLQVAIRSRRFHTWLVAPLIGGGGSLELTGMPDRDGKSMLFAWGDAMTEIGEGEHAEETADGYHWLASLFNGKTLKANRATVSWIGEWLATNGGSRG